MHNSLVSVIVPIYNVEKYLPKCIDSILNQTYKYLEIILIDDGSTDSCGMICDNYKKKDDRIIVIHKKNGGLSSARNKGLDIAKGSLISFIDSDDYIEKNMIEELIKNINEYDSDISICNFYNVKDGKKNKQINDEASSFASTGKEKFDNMKNKYCLITGYAWNKLYKKEIFDNLRFPNGKLYEYSNISCEIFDKAKKISFILKPLYNYVYRKSSIGNSFNVNHFDRVEANNKRITFFNKKQYYDLTINEKKKKVNNIIISLSKMKRYGIKNKEIWNKYYKELVNTNKKVKWRDSSRINKFYKMFRRPSISMLAFGLKVKDLIKK